MSSSRPCVGVTFLLEKFHRPPCVNTHKLVGAGNLIATAADVEVLNGTSFVRNLSNECEKAAAAAAKLL